MGPMKLRAGPPAPALKKGGGVGRVVGRQADEQHQRQPEADAGPGTPRAAGFFVIVAQPSDLHHHRDHHGPPLRALPEEAAQLGAHALAGAARGRSAPPAGATPPSPHQARRLLQQVGAALAPRPRSRGSRSRAWRLQRPVCLSSTTTGTTMPSAERWRRSRTTTSSSALEAGAVQQHAARGDPAFLAGAVPAQRQHVAVLGQQHAVRGQARRTASRACWASMRYSPWMGTR